MRDVSSRLILPVSIGVTMAAILSILINPIANIFFGKSLNSSGYYVVVLALGFASIVLGLLQVLPKLWVFRRVNEEHHTDQFLLESDKYNEKQAFHNLVSDIIQETYPDSVSAFELLFDRQEQTISALFKNLFENFEEITKQNHETLNKHNTTNQELGNLVYYLKDNIQPFSAITQELKRIAQQNQTILNEQDVKTHQQSYPIKVTMEIDGIPITIETPDANQAEDFVTLLMQRIQTTNSSLAEKKREPRTFTFLKENEETYRTENDNDSE